MSVHDQHPETLRALADELEKSRRFFEDGALRSTSPDYKRDHEVRAETYKMLAQRMRYRAGRIEKRAGESTGETLCTSHYNAVLAEYPDANMSAFRESRQRCGRCAFCIAIRKATP